MIKITSKTTDIRYVLTCEVFETNLQILIAFYHTNDPILHNFQLTINNRLILMELTPKRINYIKLAWNQRKK